MRLHLESFAHERNSFITLTYDEDHIPYADSLQKLDLQLFLKRLRHHVRPTRFRYYGVGEYGGKFDRPHYHAIIFGYDFPDRRLSDDRGGRPLYRSKLLESVWPYGYSTVQNYEIEAAAYVSKYAVKKIVGKEAPDHYRFFDEHTGEVFNREPEFARMSRRPGIGHAWLEKYHKDLYPKGYVTDGKGNKLPPPEYFNKLYEKWFPEQMEAIRSEKRQDVFERYNEANVARMEAREVIQTKNFNMHRGGKK